jgi:hypothetical protein
VEIHVDSPQGEHMYSLLMMEWLLIHLNRVQVGGSPVTPPLPVPSRFLHITPPLPAF